MALEEDEETGLPIVAERCVKKEVKFEDPVRVFVREITNQRDQEMKQRKKSRPGPQGGGDDYLMEVFEMFDVNRDGSISLKELRKAMQMQGLNPKMSEMKQIFEQYDGNNDQKLSFDEFSRLCNRIPPDTPESLVAAFKTLDKEGKSYLNLYDLKSILKTFGEKMTDEEIEFMMDMADVNRDGKVDFAEFAELLLGHSSNASSNTGRLQTTFATNIK